MLGLYALFSAGFSFTYLIRKPPLLPGFWLQIAEAALFVVSMLIIPRLSPRGRTWAVSAALMIATGLIVPAAWLAGEDQLPFLTVLPLIVAITLPEDPLPVLASGISCLVAATVILLSGGFGPHGVFAFATLCVVTASATFGVHRLKASRREFEGLKALQEELVAKERLAALGEAAAVVAHEVRNPLGAISNAVALMRKPGAPDAAQLLSMIDEEVTSLDRLVHDLLVLARPITADRRTVSVGQLLERSIRNADADGGRIRVEPFDRETCTAVVDADLFQLALANVLRNALLASPPGSLVTVSVQSDERGCTVHVRDEGPGVPEEIRGRLFEPFTTTRSMGTGLGLALARRVMDAHGGRIRLVSSGADKGGTVFEMFLPTEENPGR